MSYIFGFDPGGIGQFGWCVCRAKRAGVMTVIATGTADHAQGAFAGAQSALPSGEIPAVAGIDAPMFWVTHGGRRADTVVRNAIGRAGAHAPSGTVQHFNSLRGACVVQGLLIAKLLRRAYPGLPITEAHPKALLWLLGIENRGGKPSLEELGTIGVEHESLPSQELSEHERDAALGAFAAASMHFREQGWIDLLRQEEEPVTAITDPIGYWMPRHVQG
jgi:hypothetical protein